MPQHKSAIKRMRQNVKRRAQNRARRSKMKTLMKSVLQETDKAKAEENLKKAVSYLDKLSVKNVIHPNNAARKKSKLTQHVNNLS